MTVRELAMLAETGPRPICASTPFNPLIEPSSTPKRKERSGEGDLLRISGEKDKKSYRYHVSPGVDGSYLDRREVFHDDMGITQIARQPMVLQHGAVSGGNTSQAGTVPLPMYKPAHASMKIPVITTGIEIDELLDC